MRLLLYALGIGAALYLLALAALFFFQRSMIYPAPKEIAALPQGFEQVKLITKDALGLKAAYRPARAGKPTVVFFHGNGDSWNGAAAATRLLADSGYGVLLPEYRGYGGNPGSPSEDGLYIDGGAVLDFLTDQGISEDETVLIGNSLGSGVATDMALVIKPRALVLISAYTSLPDVASAKFPWLPVRLLMWDEFNNREKLGRVDAPVLALHGQADAVIPFANGRALAKAAPAAKFIPFAGVGHDLAYTQAGQEAVRDWLEAL